MRTNHHPEHLTYPPGKMLPKEVAHKWDWAASSQEIKKVLKKTHTRRSRQYLKRELRNEGSCE